MGRRVKFYIRLLPPVVLLLLCVFGFSSSAVDLKNDNNSLQNAMEGEAKDILDEFLSILPSDIREGAAEGDLNNSIGISVLFSEIVSAVTENGSKIGSFFLLSLGVLFLLAVLSMVNKQSAGASRIGSLAASLLLYGELMPLISEMGGAIEALNTFFGGAAGVLTSLLLASGEVNRAAVQTAGMNLTLSLFSCFGSEFLGTLAAAFFSVGIVSGVGGRGYRALAKGIRSAFFWGAGVLSTLLVGLIALQGFIASSSDSVALRAAKYAASGMIPIVGGTVSGALSTLFSGLSYAKGIIGGASVACIIAIALSPLVLLLCYRFVISAVLLIIDFLPDGAGGECFSGLASSLDALIAVYSLTGVIYILEILMFVRGGSTVF